MEVLGLTEIPQGLEDGRVRNLLALTEADFRIEDIAARLARTNRYAGATHWPYSVALHSVLVSYLCPRLPLAGLLHDIPEAFGIGDLIAPIKRKLPAYVELEEAIVSQLIRPFPALAWHQDSQVREADERAYQLECLYLRGRWPNPEHTKWEPARPNADEVALCSAWLTREWSWRKARTRFIKRYRELTS